MTWGLCSPSELGGNWILVSPRARYSVLGEWLVAFWDENEAPVSLERLLR